MLRTMSTLELLAETTDTSESVRVDAESGGFESLLHVVWPEELNLSPLRCVAGSVGVFGRTPASGANLVVPHRTVSRRHAELREAPGGGCTIRDLASHNGTLVNGERVGAEHERPLRHGDVLRLGDVVLVFERGMPVDPPTRPVSLEAVPGFSRAAKALRAELAHAAADPSPALLVGETGTGKEIAARELHRLSGRSGPFVAVNCAALSPQLVESLLFGHEAGAFTGAVKRSGGLFRQAHGGTLLLDEIGEMPLELQPKLLRVLQDRRVRAVGGSAEVEVDVRVVAATHRDLGAMVEAGTFRRDLFARLALLEVRLPPLRDRRPDLVEWLRRLAERWAEERGGDAREGGDAWFDLPPETVETLLLCPWTENLRGLDRLLRRHAVRVGGRRPLLPQDLDALLGEPASTPQPSTTRPASSRPPSGPHVPTPMVAGQRPRRPTPSREELVSILRSTVSVRGAARELDRDRRQIYRWIEAYAIEEAEWAPDGRGAGDLD